MIGSKFLLAVALVPLVVLPAARLRALRQLDMAGRLSVSAVVAFVGISLEMLVTTWLGIRWSWWLLLLPLLAASVLLGRVAMGDRRGPRALGPWAKASLPALFVAIAVIGVVAFAAGTARATSSDLLFFWGTKGERFGLAGAIDVPFLRQPEHYLMHSDYPPLLPLLYAWSTMIAGRFAWGASLLFLPLFLLLTACIFWSYAQSRLAARRAAELTAVLVGLLGYGLTLSFSAGNADGLLLFFEAVALSVLLFGRGTLTEDIIASVALAGAALTKVEGLAFAMLAVLVFGVVGRRVRRGAALLRLGGFPAASFLGWYVFCWRNGLVNIYHPSAFRTQYVDQVVEGISRAAAYESFYLPWFVVGGIWLASTQRKRGLRPALVGVGCVIGMIYFYLDTAVDPTLWIGWSGSRLLLTPLLCFFFAGAAASAAGDGPGQEGPPREKSGGVIENAP